MFLRLINPPKIDPKTIHINQTNNPKNTSNRSGPTRVKCTFSLNNKNKPTIPPSKPPTKKYIDFLNTNFIFLPSTKAIIAQIKIIKVDNNIGNIITNITIVFIKDFEFSLKILPIYIRTTIL